MGSQVIADAVAEARRRAELAQHDIDISHYQRTLPGICTDWRLQPIEWLPGGINPPPVRVLTDAGIEAVLKLQPAGELDVAAAVLRAADGDGYVRVLAWDAARGALLTERLGKDLWSAQSGLAGQIDVLAPLLRRAWVVPLSAGRRYESKAAGLAGILDRLGPRYGAAAPTALRLAAEHAAGLAATERPEVVCHGDPHAGNVLRRGAGWALIDPDGFVGERSYDLGVVLRDACLEFAEAERRRPGGGLALLAMGAQRLAAASGTDPDRVWRWGFVERVTTGLYLYWFGHPEQGGRFLDSAETIATSAVRRH